MNKLLCIAVVAMCAASGCVLHHTRSDEDAVRFARAWETPRLPQQVVALEFETQLPDPDLGYHHKLLREGMNILVDSGKFRIAGKDDKPTVRAEITVQIERDTHWCKAVFGGLLLYIIPVNTQDRTVEVFVVLRSPEGKLIDRQYTQGRGVYEMWLAYALWPAWIWNDDTADETFRDTMKAAVVKMCRALMPEAKQ